MANLQGNNAESASPRQTANVAKVAEAKPGGGVSWPEEAATLSDLTERYDVVCKCPARATGCTLYVTNAANRNGQEFDVLGGQKWKLFLATGILLKLGLGKFWVLLMPTPTAFQVAHSAATVSSAEFCISHGRSTFLKADKAEKLFRDGAGMVVARELDVVCTKNSACLSLTLTTSRRRPPQFLG